MSSVFVGISTNMNVSKDVKQQIISLSSYFLAAKKILQGIKIRDDLLLLYCSSLLVLRNLWVLQI